LGLVLAAWTQPALLALAPPLPFLSEASLVDRTVLAFSFSVSVLTGVLFGLIPAWRASRVDPQGSLQMNSWRATSGPTESRTRRLLVVGEVALALILLIGASLLVKSFAVLSNVDPGLDAEEVLTMKVSLPEARYGTPEAIESFTRPALERVRALPGVQAAAFTLTLPFESSSWVDIAIPQEEGLEKAGRALYRPMTRGYFDALKIRLVRGRLLDDLDRAGTLPVVVINESAARRYWPGKDPLGEHIILGRSALHTSEPEPREIIGVVRDVREADLGEEPPAIVYAPLWQVSAPLLSLNLKLRPQNLLIRASGEPAALAAAVQRELQALDSRQLVTGIRSMEEIIERSLGSQRFNMLLLGLMAGLALVLAAVGLYGVLSSLVNQRIRELGVRMALGATRAEVVWLVLRQGMAWVGVGVVLGVVGALGLTRLLAHLLYSISALDPAAFLVAPAVLIVVALVATWPPALRASRVEPMEILRSE
jgi:predicted permease